VMSYQTSKDYARLYRELQRETIVCFADWKPYCDRAGACRDVCETKWHAGTATIVCRGVCYVWSENETDFVRRCEEAGIEVIFPTDADAALRKAEAWVDQQGEIPGCRAAADCMLGVIREALK